MEKWIKTEDNDTTWECLQQEVINCNSKFENDIKPQPMLITFSTEHHVRKVHNSINIDQKDVEVKNFFPNIIVNFTFDPKLRMTPIVKLQKFTDNSIVSNNFLNMPRPATRKYTKKGTKGGNSSEQSLKSLKKTEDHNKNKSKLVVSEVNLECFKKCTENTYCEKPSDTVTQYQIKGKLVNLNKYSDLYPNDCYRATSKSDCSSNDETTNLMKSDFDQLWEKQEEETSMCCPNTESSTKLFSGVKPRRSIRKLSGSSKSSVENVPNSPSILTSPKMNRTRKQQATPDKTKCGDPENTDKQTNGFMSILASPVVNKTNKRCVKQIIQNNLKPDDTDSTFNKINDTLVETNLSKESSKLVENNSKQNSVSLKRKNISGKRKSKEIITRSTGIFNTQNETPTSVQKSSEEYRQNSFDENESKKVSNKMKLIEVMITNTTQSDNDLKDTSSSEFEDVLSNCKIFSRHSTDSMSSETTAPKLSNKIIVENKSKQNSVSFKRNDKPGKLKRITQNESPSSVQIYPEECQQIPSNENESKRVSKKIKHTEEMKNSLFKNTTQSDNDLKDTSSSEFEDVLSNCKIFSRHSTDSMSSETTAPKLSNKIIVENKSKQNSVSFKRNDKPGKLKRITQNESPSSVQIFPEEYQQSLSNENESKRVSKKTKHTEEMKNSLVKNTTQSDNDLKDTSSSEFEDVLSSCKIFSRHSTDSMSSETAAPKLNYKVKLSRSTLRSQKCLRKKRHTKSNIFTEILTRITSNNLLFNQRSILSEEEIDLENLMSSNKHKNFQVTVFNDSRNIVKIEPVKIDPVKIEPVKIELSSIKETPAKHIIDLRDIISPKSFEVKRPPTRPPPICLSEKPSVNSFSSFTANSSSSFLTPTSFQKTNFPPLEDDVISLFADSVIVNNNSPTSDQDLDDIDDDDMDVDDNDYSKTYSNFSAYDIDERIHNGNGTITQSNVDRNNYLDNNFKTNSIENNQLQTDPGSMDIIQKIKESENLFEMKNYASDRNNSLPQTETASTFVPSSTDFDIDKIPTDLHFNGINSDLNSFTNSLKNTQISQDISVTFNNANSLKTSPFSCGSGISTSTRNSVEAIKNDQMGPILNNFILPNILPSPTKSNTSEIMQNIILTNERTPVNSPRNIERSPQKIERSPQKNNFTTLTNDTKSSPTCEPNINLAKSPDHGDTINDEFRAHFRPVCFHFLEYGFCGTNHSELHQIPLDYENVLQKLSLSEISRTYSRFVCEYSYLLEKTMPTFAKYFGKYEDETNLIDMVRQLKKLKACNPKVKLNLMKSILDALNDFMESHVAIEKIFENIAKEDINTIDTLLELLSEEPSIENNWNLIKKLTSVEDYEIPLKVVETILNDCCNRSKIRKFHVKNVFNDIITKIADVNLLKIEPAYLDNFIKIMQNLELTSVENFKNRLNTCKSRQQNDGVFKVPAAPPVIQHSVLSSTASYITSRVNPKPDNSAFLDANSNDRDRYSPSTSTNIENHQPYKPQSKSMSYNRSKNPYVYNKRRFNNNNNNYSLRSRIATSINKNFLKGIDELRRYRNRSDFNLIVSDIVKRVSPEVAERLLKNVYNNGSNYNGTEIPSSLLFHVSDKRRILELRATLSMISLLWDRKLCLLNVYIDKPGPSLVNFPDSDSNVNNGFNVSLSNSNYNGRSDVGSVCSTMIKCRIIGFRYNI